jgi:peptidyl-prolyl cis-trans isomerase SurA
MKRLFGMFSPRQTVAALARHCRWRLALAFAAGLGMMGPVQAPAQSVVDIRAIVNDEAVTAYDVTQRLNLIIRSSSLPDTATVRRELAPRVLNSLIDETLQKQEAKRLGIKVDPKALQKALALLKQQNKLPPDGLDNFLAERGIDKQTLVNQIETSLAWSDVARRQLMRSINVTDQEVDKALDRIKTNADKPRLRVAEIFIAVDSPNDEANARRNAERIFSELRRGASFPLLARQFSQSASAERGGDLGWIQPGELEPEVEKILAKMKPNTVSEPLRTTSGFYIVALRARRDPPSKSAGETTVNLRQVVLPLPAASDVAGRQSQEVLARTIRDTVTGCADFSTVSRELGAGPSGDLGRLKLGELPADLRQLLGQLDVGAVSPPLVTENSLRLLMVCDRRSPQISLPSEEEIRRRLTLQRVEVRARRYLRDLRDAAFLDIRA